MGKSRSPLLAQRAREKWGTRDEGPRNSRFLTRASRAFGMTPLWEALIAAPSTSLRAGLRHRAPCGTHECVP